MFTGLTIAIMLLVACAALVMIAFDYGRGEPPIMTPIGVSFPPISNDVISNAEAGNSDAQLRLGIAHRKGQGAKQNYDAAAKWFKAAAERGNAEAKDQLGVLYYLGKGLQKDYKKSFDAFYEAYKMGYKNAYYNIVALNDRNLVSESDISKLAIGNYILLVPTECNEINEADAVSGDTSKAFSLWTHNCKDAFGWLQAAAAQGDPLAQNEMGYVFRSGDIVPRDYVEAVKWFSLSAEQGCLRGQVNLAKAYANGTGVKKDLKIAYKWFLLANSHGGIASEINDIEKQLGPEDIKDAQAWARAMRAAPRDKRCEGRT